MYPPPIYKRIAQALAYMGSGMLLIVYASSTANGIVSIMIGSIFITFAIVFLLAGVLPLRFRFLLKWIISIDRLMTFALVTVSVAGLYIILKDADGNNALVWDLATFILVMLLVLLANLYQSVKAVGNMTQAKRTKVTSAFLKFISLMIAAYTIVQILLVKDYLTTILDVRWTLLKLGLSICLSVLADIILYPRDSRNLDLHQ